MVALDYVQALAHKVVRKKGDVRFAWQRFILSHRGLITRTCENCGIVGSPRAKKLAYTTHTPPYIT